MVVLLTPAVKEISELLNTGLDDETLKICVQLIEVGINPEALATVVLELRRETAAVMVRIVYSKHDCVLLSSLSSHLGILTTHQSGQCITQNIHSTSAAL